MTEPRPLAVNEGASPAPRANQPARPLHRWIWIVPAAALLLFANGANTIPVASWLAPAVLLRFVRDQRPISGFPAAYLLLAGTFAFQLRGMVPIPGIGHLIFLAVYAGLLLIPYAADRLVAPRLGGVASVWVFPAAWAATEYLVSLGPFGSWGSMAYSQYGNLPLLQLLSVTGMWGVTFLIGWFASSANLLWEEGFSSRRALRAAAVFCVTLLVVMLMGGGRLALFAPASKTVRVASLSRNQVQPALRDGTFGHLLQNRASDAELEEVRVWGNAVNDDLLARTEREAAAGAKIIFWGEANAVIFKEDEARLVARAAQIAAKHQIYLGMAMASWRRGETLPLENKLILLQPTGQAAWEYVKARPVPGGEAAISVTTDGKLRSLDTPYGRMTAVICFDADFPQLLAQAGAMRADLVLDPSNDWREIDPWHTQMAAFRAIEQGANLVRHTSRGLSAAYDYQGRQLAAMDHYTAADWTLVAHVPIKGVRTIYSLLGDWFGWLCLAGLAWLIAQAWIGRR